MRGFIILGLLIGPLLLFSQKKEKYFLSEQMPKYYFETATQTGIIIRHNQLFKPEVNEPTFTFETTFGFRSFGKKAWQRKLKYPETRLTFLYSKFGNTNVFGHGFALYPNVKFWIARKKPISIFVNPGAGIAFLNKPFNRKTNPDNNVIGSKINAIIQLKIGADIRLTDRLNLVVGGAFTHYSNSKSQNPNLGINIGSAFLGLNYFPFKPRFGYNTEAIPKPKLRHEWLYKFSVGITEAGTITNGPKYPVFIHTFQYTYKTSIVNRVGGGLIFATNMAEYDELIYNNFTDDPVEKKKATDLSLFITDEILIGKVGVNFLIGAYLFDNHRKTAPVFAKVGVNYYYLNFGKQKQFGLFSGINLKSHASKAEYLEFGTGIVFRK